MVTMPEFNEICSEAGNAFPIPDIWTKISRCQAVNVGFVHISTTLQLPQLFPNIITMATSERTSHFEIEPEIELATLSHPTYDHHSTDIVPQSEETPEAISNS
jgi:hypothetical protein